MKKKIIISSATLILFVFLCYSFNWLILSGIRNVKTYEFGVWNKIVNGDCNSSIIIAGSSRAALHFVPTVISKVTGQSAYNIGMIGAAPNVQYPRLQLYLTKNKPPKIVIQEVNIMNLGFSVTLYDDKQYLPYLGHEIMYKNIVSIDKNFIWRKYLPLYGFSLYNQYYLQNSFLGLKQIIKYNPNFDFDNGFQNINIPWDGKGDEFYKENKNGKSFAIEKRGIEKIEEIIMKVKGSGSDIILVNTPEYYEIQPYLTNKKEILNIYKSIAKKHGIEFWDYSNIPMCNVKENFYNSMHLKGDSAFKFSEIFANDLKKYLAKNDKL